MTPDGQSGPGQGPPERGPMPLPQPPAAHPPGTKARSSPSQERPSDGSGPFLASTVLEGEGMDPSHYAPGPPKAPGAPTEDTHRVRTARGAGPPTSVSNPGWRAWRSPELTPPARLGTTKVPVPPTGHATSPDPCPLLRIKELDSSVSSLRFFSHRDFMFSSEILPWNPTCETHE